MPTRFHMPGYSGQTHRSAPYNRSTGTDTPKGLYLSARGNTPRYPLLSPAGVAQGVTLGWLYIAPLGHGGVVIIVGVGPCAYPFSDIPGRHRGQPLLKRLMEKLPFPSHLPIHQQRRNQHPRVPTRPHHLLKPFKATKNTAEPALHCFLTR